MKTICTTNCAWVGNGAMVSALVEHLGVVIAGTRPLGRTFPTPEAMAAADLDFYKDVVRAGYRGAYLQSLAQSVASGELDLEAFGRATRELPDDELAASSSPFPASAHAAAHVMMLLGRYSGSCSTRGRDRRTRVSRAGARRRTRRSSGASGATGRTRGSRSGSC